MHYSISYMVFLNLSLFLIDSKIDINKVYDFIDGQKVSESSATVKRAIGKLTKIITIED